MLQSSLRRLLAELPLIDAPAQDQQLASQAPIPCFQCGVCCQKWQPLLSPQELRRLAEARGLSPQVFSRRYTRAYPLRRGWRQLKATERGCIFLAFEGERSRCSIYADRPQVYQDWQAGLDKRECIEGLRQWDHDAALTLQCLYEQSSERLQFQQAALALLAKKT